MLDFTPFYRQLTEQPKLVSWLETLPLQLKHWQAQSHGHYQKWLQIIERLPTLQPSHIDLTQQVCANVTPPLSSGEQQHLIHSLKQLAPWRKGPFHLYGVHVDCEWRSDFKWERLSPHITPLTDRLVLDVGCGSGYHMWRMLGAGANFVIGIDPTALFLCQFEAVRKLLNYPQQAHLIPLGIEQMQPLHAFDTVFSMGVLYHRKSPLDHLTQLKNQLRTGGELVLETLVIEGDENTVLVPQDRYAKMKNVYFIPSVNTLSQWLKKVGFKQIRCVDCAFTELDEQRKTPWLDNESLIDFLDPNDHRKTIEGYPAPKRAILLAEK